MGPCAATRPALRGAFGGSWGGVHRHPRLALSAFGPPLPLQAWDPLKAFTLERDVESDMLLANEAVGSYVQSYNVMLTDHAWTADWQGALETLQDMRALGVTPDTTSYFACICACRRGRAWENALDLLTDAWSKDLEPDIECYGHAIRACSKEQPGEAAKLLKELRSWGPAPAPRFQTTPMLRWARQLKQYGCGVVNSIDWQGMGTVPTSPARPCWLLPNQDQVAIRVAERQGDLRHAGWKVVWVDPEVVSTLCNKASMIEYAKSKGIEASTPRCYQSSEEAVYPCILKPAVGTFGKDTHVVRSAEEVEHLTRGGDLQPKWVLQELVAGRLEYSTTLLVLNGEVVDYVNTMYEYDGEEYVWPFVQEVRHEYVSVPHDHLDVMRVLLSEFSGICCLGYKLRSDGSICIFEVNPRIGGDLVFECPKNRARALFEKLDFMF
ncbi:unnamed protein product [Effrenium voratum]|uniref:ATP-grasp domain-containing protein n=1 Tax=Effrenium voratum TaxID=2562239 RepID=A0AA36ITH9_9DINO|nr:unnamed protein product [Effrenium voratum]CAJ1420035.1 unnamed protein product [Effrenium voratum]